MAKTSAVQKNLKRIKLVKKYAKKRAALKKDSFSAAVNAETNRGKAAGLYIDRKIIKTGKLEELSEEELDNRMKKIREDYGQIIDYMISSSKVSESSLPTDEES